MVEKAEYPGMIMSNPAWKLVPCRQRKTRRHKTKTDTDTDEPDETVKKGVCMIDCSAFTALPLKTPIL